MRLSHFHRWAATLLVLAASTAAQKPRAPEYRQSATLTFNWDGHPGVRFAFDRDVQRNGPGDFERLRILVPGHPEVSFVSSDAWARITSEFGPEEMGTLPRNGVNSDYVFALGRGHGNSSIVLFLMAYGCCIGGVDVIELDPGGKPRRVLHRAHLDLTVIRDLDGDGLPELVGTPAFTETFGSCLESYDPLQVFHLGEAPGKPVRLSLPLSSAYNLAHYYGWAGPNYSETDHVIVLHPKGGGKPVITSQAIAERLSDPAKCP